MTWAPASIREAIGVNLDTVTGLTTVQRYETVAGTNELPCASLFLAGVDRVPGQEEFDRFSYQAEWHINIRLCTAASGAEVTAQKLYETLVPLVRAAFDTDGLIDPNGAGVVLDSQMTTSEMLPQPHEDGTWVCSFTLVTLSVE